MDAFRLICLMLTIHPDNLNTLQYNKYQSFFAEMAMSNDKTDNRVRTTPEQSRRYNYNHIQAVEHDR